MRLDYCKHRFLQSTIFGIDLYPGTGAHSGFLHGLYWQREYPGTDHHRATPIKNADVAFVTNPPSAKFCTSKRPQIRLSQLKPVTKPIISGLYEVGHKLQKNATELVCG
eukprot:2453173-Rhodomonas_salina.1